MLPEPFLIFWLEELGEVFFELILDEIVHVIVLISLICRICLEQLDHSSDLLHGTCERGGRTESVSFRQEHGDGSLSDDAQVISIGHSVGGAARPVVGSVLLEPLRFEVLRKLLVSSD